MAGKELRRKKDRQSLDSISLLTYAPEKRRPDIDAPRNSTSSNPFDRLAPIGSTYARLPLLQAFNWEECLADQPPRQWYVVAFRSIRSANADPLYLKLLDDLAYEEAMREPGLLLYFRGALTEQRECLSICVWDSQAKAQAATRLTAHQAAADITDDMYDIFELERWHLLKRESDGILELLPAPWEEAHRRHRRRKAVPLGTSVLVDFDATFSQPQEHGYPQ